MIDVDDQQDISDDIIPDAPAHSATKRSDFSPWHKVRKEYVRKLQWNKSIKRYIKNNLQNQNHNDKTSDTNSLLKCLVIPGDDILDIRSLHRDTEAEENKCDIKYLGFNAKHGSKEKGTQVHFAHHAVTSLDRVDKQSIVVHDSFQAVANERSQAYGYLKNHGPFHVINLDFCEDFFATKLNSKKSYYEALHRISIEQMNHMKKPWLLFITTKFNRKKIDIEAFIKFCTPMVNNMKNDDFQCEISSIVPSATIQNLNKVTSNNTLLPTLNKYNVL